MGQKLDHQSTQSFLALQFTDSLDSLYTSEYVESNPSVIISGTDFIFDYSSKANKDKYQDVVTLLKLKKSGVTFDISNAEYYNPENNVSANFSGTYTLSKFLGNDKIILSNVSGATWDSKQKLYKGAKSRYCDWCEQKNFKWAHRIIPEGWLLEKGKRMKDQRVIVKRRA